jgi:chromosome segregation ATPase
MDITYPSDEVLIARGKYSTLSSQRRELLKGLQRDVEQLANNAHRILRAHENIDHSQNELDRASELVEAAQDKLDVLKELAPLLAELEPQAWGQF